LRGPQDWINALAVLNDGSLASGSNNGDTVMAVMMQQSKYGIQPRVN
jgi:hypothetical protein